MRFASPAWLASQSRCAQMLEIGIMIHSLVIGLTLAITSGPEFSK